MRCGVYARFSSDVQHPASIDDQRLACQRYVDQHGWAIVTEHQYADEALSGMGVEHRPSYRRLLAALASSVRPFDVLLVDDLSRLSRDAAEILRLVRSLQAAGINTMEVIKGTQMTVGEAVAATAQRASKSMEQASRLLIQFKTGRADIGFAVGVNGSADCAGVLPGGCIPAAAPTAFGPCPSMTVLDASGPTVTRLRSAPLCKLRPPRRASSNRSFDGSPAASACGVSRIDSTNR